jgi:hypothetical protein
MSRRGVACVAVALSLGGLACTDRGETPATSTSTSTTAPDDDRFDQHALSECPEQIEAGDMSGGRLAAAYDTTWLAASELISTRDPGIVARGSASTVVCWYSDVLDAAKEAQPGMVVTIYIEGEQLTDGGFAMDGPPTRP